jgi:import receptor subunit TOM70
MDRAYKITPKNAMILVHKGLLMIQARGNVDEAVKWISKAIEVDGKCEYAYETLATLEVQRFVVKFLVIAVKVMSRSRTNTIFHVLGEISRTRLIYSTRRST